MVGFVCFFRYLGGSIVHYNRGSKGSYNLHHFHKDQLTLYKNKEPAATVGSLREKVMMESLTAFIETIVTSPDPKALFEEFSTKIAEVFDLRGSIKHMRGMSFDQMRPMK